MPTLDDFRKWPPWPLSNLIRYLTRLSDAFGKRYIAAIILCYGVNQGVGEGLVYFARRYYLIDEVGLSAKHVTQLLGFAGIPWQLKSLFGVLSDTVPLNGLHRSPYMLFAGVVGVLSTCLLLFLPPHAFGAEAYGLLFMAINLNFAMPDVMIDATVAERSIRRPEFAAELQALCWGAINTIGIPFSIAKGYLYEWGGAKLIFGLCIATAACVLVPPVFGWVEERKPGPRGLCGNAQQVANLCRGTCTERMKRNVVGAAGLVGVFSLGLGVINLLARDWAGLTLFCLVADCVLCAGLYVVLRRVDRALAGAAVYTFLSRALCPSSTKMFEWMHDPGFGADGCFTAAQCCEKLRADSDPALACNVTLMMSPSPPPPPPWDGAPADYDFPCGWATQRMLPCITPIFNSWAGVAGRLALSLGVWAYVSFFQKWPFRRIFATTQGLMCLFSFADFLWVMRLNRAFGISDEMWMLFGDEVAFDFVYKLNQLPFLIYAAKLCPPGVEASMFSLFMGLSNFGGNASEYLGSGLLAILGDVPPPTFPNLELLVFISCACKALPILLVPFLVPTGTPMDTAKEMGAGANITGEMLTADESTHGGGSEEANNGVAMRPAAGSPSPVGLSSVSAKIFGIEPVHEDSMAHGRRGNGEYGPVEYAY